MNNHGFLIVIGYDKWDSDKFYKNSKEGMATVGWSSQEMLCHRQNLNQTLKKVIEFC